jgi:hypothetical protein
MQNLKKTARALHLIELMMDKEPNTKRFAELIIYKYDTFMPRAEDSKVARQMLWDWEPFYKGNKRFLMKAYKIHDIEYKTYGDPEEPESWDIIAEWVKGTPDEMWGIYNKIQAFIQLCLLQYNCCDRVCNPDPKFKHIYLNPTPDSWALGHNNSWIQESWNLITLNLRFYGHYHS